MGGILVFLGWYVLLPAAVVTDWYLSFPFWDGLGTVSIAWSISLYFWLAGNLIMALKVPVLERILPYDRRIRLHILSSVAIIIGFVWHVASKFLMGTLIDTLSWVLLGACGLWLLGSALWSPMPGLRTVRARLGKGLARTMDRVWDGLRLVHGFGFATLIALSWFHIHGAGIDTMGVSGLVQAYPAVTVLSLGLWAWSWIRLLWAPRGHVSTLETRENLTILTVELDHPLAFHAGQFTFLAFPGSPGLRARHPFSFLDPPGPGGTSMILRFAMKPGGDFSNRVADLAPGAAVRLTGAFGAFRPSGRRPALLIGTGIGSVPVLSLAASPGPDARDRQGTLRYLVSVDARADLPVAINAEPPTPQGALTCLEFRKDGRLIDAGLLARHLEGHAPRDWEVLVCASPRMRTFLEGELRRLGVPKRRIRHEAFGY